MTAHVYSSFRALVMSAAALAIAADNKSAHKIDMSDPYQNIDFQTGTSVDQMRLAIKTLQTELMSPDSLGMDADDADEAKEALSALARIIKRIETKMASYMAQHREPPPSNAKAHARDIAIVSAYLSETRRSVR